MRKLKLRDRLWLWGQTEGSHHINDAFKIPGTSRMTPLEGAYYFGIPNMFRVVMAGLPQLPFDQDAMVLDTMDNVVWSIIGDGTTGAVEFADEVLRLARIYPNITGGIMDDFMSDGRMALFPVERVRSYKERLHTEVGRRLDLWTVIYENELTETRRPYIAECDILTFWTWKAEGLRNLAESFKKLSDLSNGQKIYAGCYMWDYGNHKQMPLDLMAYQLDAYYSMLKSKQIAGIILCSNCCADVGLKTVDMAREWIKKHGDEDI